MFVNFLNLTLKNHHSFFAKSLKFTVYSALVFPFCGWEGKMPGVVRYYMLLYNLQRINTVCTQSL